MTQPSIASAATVLIVDESDAEQSLLESVLGQLYKVIAVGGTEAASRVIDGDQPPDVIILRDGFPEGSSLDFCRQLKRHARTRDIPLILLINRIDETSEFLALGLGPNEYVARPINPAVLLDRVTHQLRLNLVVVDYRSRRVHLEQELDHRSSEVNVLKEVTILALASLAETRDADTENHARRTQNYVSVLADCLAAMPKYEEQLDGETRRLLISSAPLHDIGKIGIPDNILLKQGPLTPDEYEVMKTHTTLGRDAIQRAEDQLGLSVPFLKVVKELAYSHHERWDGHGYPEGRSGYDIPLSARLMAVADVYDALISRRAYRSPMSHEQVATYIVGKRSVDFDPDITDAFNELQGQFFAISRDLASNQNG